MKKNPHSGGDFQDFLAEEGLLPEVEALAMKKAIALQLQRILEEEQVSKSQLNALKGFKLFAHFENPVHERGDLAVRVGQFRICLDSLGGG